LLDDVKLEFMVITDQGSIPLKMEKSLEVAYKKIKRIELIMKFISNAALLYASDYLKHTYDVNAFDDPNTID